uniref:uncharacterized protein n=1 Tax=Myxine glutinosa TaxID=7769 RepID=UPI00358F20A2
MGDHREEAARRGQNFPNLCSELILALQDMLHSNNALVNSFKSTLERMPSPDYKVVIRADKRPHGEHERRFNEPVNNDVAVLMVGEQYNNRDIVLHLRDNSTKRISETHRFYDALQYPLIFWKGQDGYHFEVEQACGRGKKVSANDFYAFHIMVRKNSTNHILQCRDLFHQFIVDMYAKIESERLLFIRLHQRQLRAESYAHLRDAVNNDGDVQNMGQLVILPSTFTGGPRYMHERTQDAMAYVRNYGRPDLFLTFTFKGEEIKRELMINQQPTHRHDIVARVFHQKRKELMQTIKKGKVFGTVRCFMYTIEWQKRGLPHAHILVWLEEKIHASNVDSSISAELPKPDEDPELFNIVKTQMVHGPCGRLNPSSPCMKDGKCTKQYPRAFLKETQTGLDGYPLYRRRKPESGGSETSISISETRSIDVDNRWIVPYCPFLSKMFKAHLNVEFCNSVKSIKYVCKYVNKCSDMAMFGLQRNKNDEIESYQLGRYVSSNEAIWRVLNFPIHECYPTVVHLSVHLENGQRVYFTEGNARQKAAEPPSSTTLTAFFQLCQQDEFAKTLIYNEVPQYYTWEAVDRLTDRLAVRRGKDVHKEHELWDIPTFAVQMQLDESTLYIQTISNASSCAFYSIMSKDPSLSKN